MATALLLRVGLAFVFLYAGLGSLLHPREWTGYLPTTLTDHIDKMVLIKFLGVYELVLAVWLLSGMWVQYAALLAAATLGGILVSNPHALLITFRDVGLLFAALALAASAFGTSGVRMSLGNSSQRRKR